MQGRGSGREIEDMHKAARRANINSLKRTHARTHGGVGGEGEKKKDSAPQLMSRE